VLEPRGCGGENLHVSLQVYAANVCRSEAVVPLLVSHKREGKKIKHFHIVK